MVEGVAGYSVLRYRGLVFCSEVGRSTIKADVEAGIMRCRLNTGNVVFPVLTPRLWRSTPVIRNLIRRYTNYTHVCVTPLQSCSETVYRNCEVQCKTMYRTGYVNTGLSLSLFRVAGRYGVTGGTAAANKYC